MTDPLTHLDEHGRAKMVDVGDKPVVRRRAVAEAYFCAAPETLERVMSGAVPKGEALATARLAGIAAAKRTDEWIPLCHTLPLDVVEIDFARAEGRLRITATCATTARTGVEMEALTAVAAAALTLHDMTKAIDRDLRIEGVRVVSKQKG